MVRVPRASTSASSDASLGESFISSRSAESWIGVSGFLISCARRRATSAHAVARCAWISWVMSSNTSTYPPAGSCGRAVPRTSSVLPVLFSSTSCCQGSAPWERNCSRISAAKASSSPPSVASAPWLVIDTCSSWSNTSTPAERLARMFSRRALALSSAVRFASTTARASPSWRVIELNDSVSTPSSSPLVTGAWRLKSPRATAWVACARLASGSESRLASTTASAIATSSAMDRVSVSVTI